MSGPSGPAAFAGRAVRELRTRRDILLVVAAGGALGSLARWVVALQLPHEGRQFPWATFCVNVAGCGLIGALMFFEEELLAPSRYRRAFLRTGILGGFTTFSTYGLDTHTLLLAGAVVVAGVYVLGSIAAGLAAVRLGNAGAAGAVALARRRHRRPDGRLDLMEDP